LLGRAIAEALVLALIAALGEVLAALHRRKMQLLKGETQRRRIGIPFLGEVS
jgi:hypothetical protein